MKAVNYPHSYETIRTIRNEKRKVHVTKFSREQEKLEFLNPKPRKRQYRRITRQEARNFQKTRSPRAKALDAKMNTKNFTNTEAWMKAPHKFDYKGVDGKESGSEAGNGRKSGLRLRHANKTKKKKRTP